MPTEWPLLKDDVPVTVPATRDERLSEQAGPYSPADSIQTHTQQRILSGESSFFVSAVFKVVRLVAMLYIAPLQTA